MIVARENFQALVISEAECYGGNENYAKRKLHIKSRNVQMPVLKIKLLLLYIWEYINMFIMFSLVSNTFGGRAGVVYH